MATVIHTRDLHEISQGNVPAYPEGLDRNLTHQAYNGLDSAITLRVLHSLRRKLAECPNAQLSYQFVRAMQGPAMAMMMRGVAVNLKVRHEETERYTAIRKDAQTKLDALANAVWGPETYTVSDKVREAYTPLGKRGNPLTPRFRTITTERAEQRPRGLNAASNKQCLAFFNVALRCPVEYEIRKAGVSHERTPSANNKALRKWAKFKSKGPGVDVRDRSTAAINIAQPFVSLILTIRDADKMLDVLQSPLDPDGRMRCSYNVVGTENGRWSSSANAFGRGTNLQNITPTMRRMFCADDGYRFISTDLEQAESRLVAALVWQVTGDDTYWRACESSDLHTVVCQMSWPELEWSDDQKANRRIADRPYPGLNGKFSYRDVAKRIGHGSNYNGSPGGIAQAIGIPVPVVQDFQRRYFVAFPAIPLWHAWTRRQVIDFQYLDTPLGRRRWFFGRPTEDSTIREAIAFVPQSTIGELLNLAMLNTWERSVLPPNDERHLPLELLLQNHDAFAFQTPISTPLAPLLAAVKSELEIPIPIVHHETRELRYLTIPGEFVTGYNWAYKDKGESRDWKFKDGNPDGLAKWGGSDDRKRQQGARSTAGDWLDRVLS